MFMQFQASLSRTRARHHGRAAAMGVAVEPSALAIAGPGWWPWQVCGGGDVSSWPAGLGGQVLLRPVTMDRAAARRWPWRSPPAVEQKEGVGGLEDSSRCGEKGGKEVLAWRGQFPWTRQAAGEPGAPLASGPRHGRALWVTRPRSR